MAFTAPLPFTSPVLATERDHKTDQDVSSPFISVSWREYLLEQRRRINAGPERLTIISKTAQSASIGTTSLLASPSAGLYRVSVYARITRAASTSSSLIVTISWTEGGVSCSRPLTALTGNTTATTPDPPFTVVLRSDVTVPISYATTYVTSGATSMQYRLDVAVEELPA